MTKVLNESYWGPIDSNVDWCEPNYVYTQYVAEFFNTMSSIPISLFALLGIVYARRYASTEIRYTLAYSAVVIVGLGSVLFHGTLRRWAQACDELPMLYSVYTLTYITHDNQYMLPRNNVSFNNTKLTIEKLQHKLWLKLALFGAAVMETTIYYMYEDLYILFFISFVGAVIYLISTTHHTITNPATLVVQYDSNHNTNDRLIHHKLYYNKYVDFHNTRYLFNYAVLCYGIASTFWLSEIALCSYLPQWAYFHAMWHLFSGAATYLSIQAQLSWRASLYDRIHHVYYLLYCIPYVSIEPVQLDHISID